MAKNNPYTASRLAHFIVFTEVNLVEQRKYLLLIPLGDTDSSILHHKFGMILFVVDQVWLLTYDHLNKSFLREFQ
jgi:hypothetical protein